MDLAPRFASSLFVSVRHSVPLGARLSPFAVEVSTTLFDAEERLLKRSRKAPRCPRIDLDHKRISETRVRTVSSTAPGQGKGVGEEPPFPRPVTKGLWQSHIVGGSYVYVAAPIGPGLSEKTNWERRGDKKHLLPENPLRIRMLPAGFEPASEARKAPILDRTRLRERKAGLVPNPINAFGSETQGRSKTGNFFDAPTFGGRECAARGRRSRNCHSSCAGSS